MHPQFWPEDLDYGGQRVVIIGSGATAVTLLPEMAKTAAHVTMLQRSPTWVVARPSEDALANRMRRWLPAKAAYALTRWKRVLLGMYFYGLCQRKPEKVKSLLLGGVRAYLGPDYDVDKHFTPRYKPWDQRLCLVPDGDFFLALRKKKASVVTDQIECFTETGVKLKSGEELPADLVVTATGLELKVLGGLQLSVDGQPVDLAQTVSYKAMMYSGVPNLAVSMGYTNASWTLKCDLTCEYVCRLLNHMRDARPAPVHADADRCVDAARAVERFHLRLRAARGAPVPQARHGGAVEAEAELHPRPADTALGQGGRRRDGVLESDRADAGTGGGRVTSDHADATQCMERRPGAAGVQQQGVTR